MEAPPRHLAIVELFHAGFVADPLHPFPSENQSCPRAVRLLLLASVQAEDADLGSSCFEKKSGSFVDSYYAPFSTESCAERSAIREVIIQRFKRKNVRAWKCVCGNGRLA